MNIKYTPIARNSACHVFFFCLFHLHLHLGRAKVMLCRVEVKSEQMGLESFAEDGE